MQDDAIGFSVAVEVDGDARVLTVDGFDPATGEPTRLVHLLPSSGQQHYLDFYQHLAGASGTRLPHNRAPRTPPPATVRHRPLLTTNLSPDILYGYGDPALLWVPEERAWYMVATSNDAPDSFPILRTTDLIDWRHAGFVFPRGAKPEWAQDGVGVSDFWAPELHRVGNKFLLCFSARERDRSLSVGIAWADWPDGPFTTPSEPLLRGGVIDAHVFVEADGDLLLLWKQDSNGIWPRRLAGMIAADPGLADALLALPEDRRTARLVAALWSWGQGQPPMEQFFLLQPLIEAVVDNFADVRRRLAALATEESAIALAAMRTPIYAQRLAGDGSALLGAPRVVLVNDLDWEGHLIEGPWLTAQGGRFYLFYAGNDFSTHEYGIGVAVADTPLGPFRKMARPLLCSDRQWAGPGHPSVAPGPDGKPRLFYHAFVPGRAGYNEFRALLTVGLRFGPNGVDIDDA